MFGGGGDELAQEWRDGEEVLTTLLLEMPLSELIISQEVVPEAGRGSCDQQFHEKMKILFGGQWKPLSMNFHIWIFGQNLALMQL